MNKIEYKISDFGDFNKVVILKEINSKQSFILYFNNCDYINGSIFFILNKFQGKIEIPFECDHNFWRDFTKLYNKKMNTKKELIFIGKHTDILKQKENGNVIMFSGGKESVVSLHILNTNRIVPKVGVYVSSVHNYNLNYLVKNGFLTEEIYKFSSNVDELLYFTAKDYISDLHTIISVLSKYKVNFIGVNKMESNIECCYLINYDDLQLLFEKYGLEVASVVSNMSLRDIVCYAKEFELDFLKCGGEDFCYRCSECVELLYTLPENCDIFNPDSYMIKKLQKVKNKFTLIKNNFEDKYILNHFKRIFNEKEKKHCR